MGRTKPRQTDTATIVRALELVAEGRTSTEAAAVVGCSATSVRGWAERYGVQLERAHGPDEDPPPISATAGGDDEDPPDPDLDEPLPEGTTTLEDARLLQREAWALARKAERAGNYGAAQRARRDAMSSTTVIARIERWQGDGGDRVSATRSEIDRAMKSLHAKAEVMRTRPLLCAHCHRALMVAWGRRRPALAEGAAPAEQIPGGSVVAPPEDGVSSRRRRD